MTPLVKCPICGSRKIQRKKESVELHPRGHTITVPAVTVDTCLNCGEKFFDHDASVKIDAALPAASRSAIRRKSA